MTPRVALVLVVSVGWLAGCGGPAEPSAPAVQPNTTVEPNVEPVPDPVVAVDDTPAPPEPPDETPAADPCDELSTPKEELAEPDYEAGRLAWGCAKAAAESEKFEVARWFYIVAHRYTKDATIYYWIADSTRHAGDCPGAVIYYELYLINGSPDEDYRKLTVDAISQCEAGAVE